MKQCPTCSEVYKDTKTCPCPSHGGARGGAGRKQRLDPKSKPIWCGQIPQEDRAFIVKWLSPEDRYQVLMTAANNACTRRGAGWAIIGRVRVPHAGNAIRSTAPFGQGVSKNEYSPK